MTEHLLQIVKSGKGVEEAGIPPIDFRGFHQTFSGVAAPGRDAAHKIEAFEQIQIVAGGLAVDPQRAGHFAQIEGGSLLVGEHRAQPPRNQWRSITSSPGPSSVRLSGMVPPLGRRKDFQTTDDTDFTDEEGILRD